MTFSARRPYRVTRKRPESMFHLRKRGGINARLQILIVFRAELRARLGRQRGKSMFYWRRCRLRGIAFYEKHCANRPSLSPVLRRERLPRADLAIAQVREWNVQISRKSWDTIQP